MWCAGLALKQLIDDDQGEVGGPRHTGAPRSSKPKGKWLATTIKDTMTSISMNEDLYESDDEFLPPSAFTSWVCPCPSSAETSHPHQFR